MDFWILQLQQIHPFRGPGFWTLHAIKIFAPGFRIQGKI